MCAREVVNTDGSAMPGMLIVCAERVRMYACMLFLSICKAHEHDTPNQDPYETYPTLKHSMCESRRDSVWIFLSFHLVLSDVVLAGAELLGLAVDSEAALPASAIASACALIRQVGLAPAHTHTHTFNAL